MRQNSRGNGWRTALLWMAFAAGLLGQQYSWGEQHPDLFSFSTPVVRSPILQTYDTIRGDQFRRFIEQALALEETQRQAVVDSFLQTIASFPFIEQDTLAYFIYTGDAGSVSVPGDANGWNLNAYFLQRLSGTDCWYYEGVFESDARLDYKFVLNGSRWILDPRNPRRVTGGYGPNSELAMPAYVQPLEIRYYDDIPHGDLHTFSFHSDTLANTRTITVYTPPGWEAASRIEYPLMLLHDGSEYIQLGRAERVIDYLLAQGRMEPIIAAFVPPVQRNEEYAFSKTGSFAAFIIDELLPYIEAHYRIEREPGRRAMVGISFGGHITAEICHEYPGSFGLCGLFSAAFWPNDKAVLQRILASEPQNIDYYIDWGSYEFSVMLDGRNLRDNLLNKDNRVKWREWHEGHSWGSWRAHLDEALEFFFPASSTSQLDEPQIELPETVRLGQNFPNPCNPTTHISVTVSRPVSGYIVLYDLRGRELRRSPERHFEPGHHIVSFNLGGLPSGVYLYSWGEASPAGLQKMILLK